jgi:acetate---CoA ligase (ADP-forming)
MASWTVAKQREHGGYRMSAIERLIRPRSVAVVGASADASKLAGRPVDYLQKHGFSGAIYPINPRVTQIGSLACYPDVLSLPEVPDVGLVLLGQEGAQQAVCDLAACGAAAAIVLASGYGETGEEGARREQALKKAAGHMRLLGPNTIGLVNLNDGVVLSASGALEIDDLPTGRISVVSQSGGILGSLLSRAADRGIGFAKLIATGNEADLDSNDFIEYLLDDEISSVIAIYMEGLRQPEKFRNLAVRAAALGKPIVVFKVGRSQSGARAASSHTGALAGADRVYDALFRQFGVIRATTFSDLLDIPAALVSGRRALGRRVAILTSTGGAGTLIADGCGLAGFDLPTPDEATTARLAEAQGVDRAAAGRNPIDVTLAGLRRELFCSAIGLLLGSPSYDAVIVIVGSSALASPTIVVDAVVACHTGSDKPLLTYVSPHAPHLVRLLNRQGVPSFATPESLAAVLEALQLRTVALPQPDRMDPSLQRPPPGELVAGAMDEAQSKALFARFGIPVVREEAVASGADAETAARRLGPRVVLKIRSQRIRHKSDLGGVKVGVAADEVHECCQEMLTRLRAAGAPEPEGFLVQELVTGGVEMILGIHRDPQLGPIVLLGMGGVAVDLFDDVAIRLLPISRIDAQAMIGELRTGKLLSGFRGAKPCDVEALVGAVLCMAAMGEALADRLVAAEINPLVVLPEGRGVCAVDGLVVLRAGPDVDADDRGEGRTSGRGCC